MPFRLGVAPLATEAPQDPRQQLAAAHPPAVVAEIVVHRVDMALDVLSGVDPYS